MRTLPPYLFTSIFIFVYKLITYNTHVFVFNYEHYNY